MKDELKNIVAHLVKPCLVEMFVHKHILYKNKPFKIANLPLSKTSDCGYREFSCAIRLVTCS